MLRLEGSSVFYAGLKPALLRHIPYSGTRIMVFEQLRDVSRVEGGGSHAAGGEILGKMASGMVAGAAGQLVAVPADLVKVRMQSEVRNAAGRGREPARYSEGVLSAFSEIVAKEGGVRGLWRGALPAVQRAALVNLGELATYDLAKSRIVESGFLGGPAQLQVHLASAACSGLAAGLVSTPADVVKTRLMRQDQSAPLYRGPVDCLLKSLRAEGLRGLYKGFLPTWARLGPWQMAFWVTYEQLCVWSGAGAF
mmetsp:Transcript_27735/g.65899  ORF Transcript_27735/g.65899 Transcript_27735/m.65899 type:complete len:252 (-) Transcript_27735:149-904(-)